MSRESRRRYEYLQRIRTLVNPVTIGHIEMPMSPFAGNVLASEGMDDGKNTRHTIGQSRLAHGDTPFYDPGNAERWRVWKDQMGFPEPRMFF